MIASAPHRPRAAPLRARGVHGRSRLRAADRRRAACVAHRLSASGRRCQHALVGAVQRPGADRARRIGVARQPRPRDRRGARGRVHGPARDDAQPVLSAGELQPQRQPQSKHGRRHVAALAARHRPLLHAVPGRARRGLAARPVRPRPPPDRSRAGPRLRHRARTPRRRAVARHGDGSELHRLARARPPARDLAADRAELRQHAAHLRAAPQGRRGVEARARAGAIAIPAGARGHSLARAAHRRPGEPDRRPAGKEPVSDSARQDDRPARAARHPRRPALLAPIAPTGHPASRAGPRRRQRRHRRGARAVLPAAQPHGLVRLGERGLHQLPHRALDCVVARRRTRRPDLHRGRDRRAR